MTSQGQYLYGIIRIINDIPFGNIGNGIQGKEVYIIPYEDIAAVISDHPNVKIKPLRLNLKSHHEVIKKVSNRFTIIPIAFGHIVNSKNDTLSLLSINYGSLNEELNRLRGKSEMGLKVFCDVENIFEYFVKRHQDLKDFRDRVYGRSLPPRREEMIELGKYFEEKLQEEREHVTSMILDVLRDSTLRYRSCEPINEKMVVNLAFLIDKDKEKCFEEGIYKAASRFDGNFSFDYSGPWVPFSFVKVELEFET